MPAGGAREGAGRKRRFVNPVQMHIMVDASTRAQLMCMIEGIKERESRASASMLIGALIEVWMEKHREEYLLWAKDNLRYIHDRFHEEFCRLTTLLPEGAFYGYDQQYIKECRGKHVEWLAERDLYADEYADEDPKGLL